MKKTSNPKSAKQVAEKKKTIIGAKNEKPASVAMTGGGPRKKGYA